MMMIWSAIQHISDTRKCYLSNEVQTSRSLQIGYKDESRRFLKITTRMYIYVGNYCLQHLRFNSVLNVTGGDHRHRHNVDGWRQDVECGSSRLSTPRLRHHEACRVGDMETRLPGSLSWQELYPGRVPGTAEVLIFVS